MSFDTIDADAVFAGLQFPDSTETPEVKAPAQVGTPELETKTDDTSTPPASAAGSPKEPVQTKPPESDVRIPKARLDHEIAQRKAVAAQLEQANKELEQLRKSTKGDKTPDPLDLDAADDLETKIQGLEKWKADMEWNTQVSTARTELDATVAAIMKEHPEVKSNILYAAVIQNPKVDLWNVAEQYTGFIGEIRADERSKAGITGNTQRPAAIPRPASSSSPTQGSALGEKGPQTMEEARARTLALLG